MGQERWGVIDSGVGKNAIGGTELKRDGDGKEGGA